MKRVSPFVRWLSVMTPPKESSIIAYYKSLVLKGELSANPNQLNLVRLLEKVDENAVAYQEYLEQKKGDAAALRPRGLYLFGAVGTGKTIVMDTYLKSSRIVKKRRVHFHKFMLEVHSRIHAYKQHLLTKYWRERKLNLTSERDAIAHVARKISVEARILCFDEFQVTDICDAMILTKLFSELWKNGTIAVITSNRPPDDLYKDGLNREYFLPFIERLKVECIVRQLQGDDYRARQSPMQNAFYVPSSSENKSSLWEDFINAVPAVSPTETQVTVVMGRSINVLSINHHACWVEFQYLCDDDRGAADFQALARTFNIIFLVNIPVMSLTTHDRARRFITLIDELYDSGCLVRWTADAMPEHLFRHDHAFNDSVTDKFKVKTKESFLNDDTRNFTLQLSSPEDADTYTTVLEGASASVKELSFAFKRTSSRLTEMASINYFNRWKEKVMTL